MSYGLYDADLPFYPIPFFNLELMKISAYYKRKKEIVSLSPNFSPNLYTNFIVRQDFYSSKNYPLTFNNVSYGGRVFDGAKYKPLPYEIEIMKPDKYIYNKINMNIKGYHSSGSIMKRAEHVRLSLDGSTIWKDFDKQLLYNKDSFGMIFHDYNLNEIEGARAFIKDNIKDIINYKLGHSIGTKYPIQTKTEEDFIGWLSFKPLNQYYNLEHQNILGTKNINNLAEVTQTLIQARQVSINVTANTTQEKLIKTDLQRIYRSIINLRIKGLVFPLIYDENVFIDKDWRMVMKLINIYNKHLLSLKDHQLFNQFKDRETMYSFARSQIKSANIKNYLMTPGNLSYIFNFVRENNYDLFVDFYEYFGEEVK